ncbi:hypothetical protein Tco_1095877 [Tanacetum coccineum]
MNAAIIFEDENSMLQRVGHSAFPPGPWHRQLKLQYAMFTLFSPQHICFERFPFSLRSYSKITSTYQVSSLYRLGSLQYNHQAVAGWHPNVYAGLFRICSPFGGIHSILKRTCSKNDITSLESSLGIKKYQGLNSNDGSNTRNGVKIAGGVIGFGDEIELKEMLPDEAVFFMLPTEAGKIYDETEV